MALANNAPRPVWTRAEWDGYAIHRLWLDGKETPYFLQEAKVMAHRSQGYRVGLFGSGMGNAVRRRDGTTYRIAAFLEGADRIGLAKHRAEQRAMGDDR